MAVALTLYQGENKQEYVEHPTEVARRALLAAAEVESGWLVEVMRRFASALPPRAPIREQA